MAIIKPTFNLTANSSDATTDTGPLSFSLDLSTTVDITCDDVHQGIVTIADATSPGFLFKGETQDWRSGTLSGVGDAAPGYGGFVYLKNVSAAASDIYIGIAADDEGGAEELQDAADVDGGDSFAVDFFRWCTLKQNEFAFFPWDYSHIYTYDASGAATLEWWIFDR